jgi:polysaccharide export outer membrane protein
MKNITLLSEILLVGLLTAPSVAQEPATRKRTVGDTPVPAAGQEKSADKSAVTAQDKSEKSASPSQEKTTGKPVETTATAGAKTGDSNTQNTDVPAEAIANRRGQMSEEEAAVLPYYNNFMTSYRLGPEDVISVSVFGQERYSKSGIVVPPDGRISYPLIPEGVFVAGKSVQQVQEELTKRLDEYIIDPKISVALEKAMSARYSVLGDVAQPGIRVMTRRLSVYEAVAEAGGVLSTGDKSKVFVLRRQADGSLRPFAVNIKEIERGRAKEVAFLSPGDQVVVPGNRMKKIKEIMDLASVVSFARIFTGGLF